MGKGRFGARHVVGPSALDLLCCHCMLPDCLIGEVRRGCLRWRAQQAMRKPGRVLEAIGELAGGDGWCGAGLQEIAVAAGEHWRVLDLVRMDLARRRRIECRTVVREGRLVRQMRLN